MPSTPQTPALVSIGYEGKDLNELLEQLLANHVGVLVDVRLNPISRKPGLSKRRLSEALRAVGISYCHYRELGNPKENREAFRAGSQDARDRFSAILRAQAGTEALSHVAESLDGEVVALLCFEREHSECHRGLVAEAIQRELPEVQLLQV
ncbi:DUF488 family protein [Oryzobacter telluris]|uniref:DUF488 domain-containing protein n=1 Tax=Oryzobacter telluris TaxID=3149179 RepID=UPI00370D2E16